MNPLRTYISIRIRRTIRHIQNFRNRKVLAQEKSQNLFPYLIKEHSTPIFRKLAGIDPLLFQNKKTNLKIAIEGLQGIMIRPHQIFSFWTLVGNPKAQRGFLEGLGIERGRGVPSVGGGLCQLSNALFWLALHSDLQVVERHHHSLDLFPDDHRTIPFGTGATVVYNFKDIRFLNSTSVSFQFFFELTEDRLIVRLYSSAPQEYEYRIKEKDHEFQKREDGLYRKNVIAKETYCRSKKISEEVLFKNDVKCQYSIDECGR